MNNVISFAGVRQGVGNSALLRAFAVEAAGSLYCTVVDFDAGASSTCDWAVRRDRNGFTPSIKVERAAAFSFPARYADTELVMIDHHGCDLRSAIDAAKKSRLLVLTSTTAEADLAGVLDWTKAFIEAGVNGRVVAALCRVDILDEDMNARRMLVAGGVNLLAGEITEHPLSYPRLEREGRAMCEPRSSLAQAAAQIVDGIQKAYLERDPA